jgi:hypothetical protein
VSRQPTTFQTGLPVAASSAITWQSCVDTNTRPSATPTPRLTAYRITAAGLYGKCHLSFPVRESRASTLSCGVETYIVPPVTMGAASCSPSSPTAVCQTSPSVPTLPALIWDSVE